MIKIETKNEKKSLDIPEAFIKFDKKFITLRDNPSKLLLVMSYLKIYSSLNGYIGISLDLLAKRIGYTPDHRRDRLNDNLIKILDWLQKRDAIYLNEKEFPLHDIKDKTIKRIKRNDCFILQVNNTSPLFSPDGFFVFLTESEFYNIINSEIAYDKQDILNVYLNIKKYINFDGYSQPLCFPSHTALSKDCGLSRGVINNIINDLVLHGLLYTYNSGRFEDNNGKIKYANSFYAIKDSVLKPDICNELIRNYYSSQGIIIGNFIK